MACGCGNKHTLTQIASRDGSSLPTLKYLHCKYKDQFEFLFSKIGITANESNLKLLAVAHDTGSDKKGIIKDSQGRPIYFSVEETIQKIDQSRVANNQCSI